MSGHIFWLVEVRYCNPLLFILGSPGTAVDGPPEPPLRAGIAASALFVLIWIGDFCASCPMSGFPSYPTYSIH